MTKKIAVALAGLMAIGSLVACTDPEDDNGIDTGVVIERSRGKVVVLEDDGEKDKHKISKTSTKCQIGSRWPDCKR